MQRQMNNTEFRLMQGFMKLQKREQAETCGHIHRKGTGWLYKGKPWKAGKKSG